MLCRVDTTAADRTLYVAVKCLEDNWQLEIFRIPVLHSQYSKRRLEIDLTAYQNKSVDRYVIHNLCMSALILEKISFFFFLMTLHWIPVKEQSLISSLQFPTLEKLETV